MSRVIKFRAFDEQNLVMHNDFRFIKSGEDGNDWIVFTSDKQLLTDTPHPFDNPYFQQQLKVMQFTGLKDINGVEIYEGDICIWYINNLERLGEVYYHDQSFEMRSPSLGYIGWDANRGEIEVIGNIYQNPELLK